MRELSKYLISRVGSQQVIDPISKEDALWSLIDFFTKTPEFYRVSQQSASNTISPNSVAEYLGNQLERNGSLDKIIKVALRLDSLPQSQAFVDELLLKLKAYQNLNSANLPASVSKDEVRKLYLKLRAQKNLKLGKNTQELILYLLKSSGLNAEVIDFCSLDQVSANNQLRAYYLSETLLQTPIKKGKTYFDALVQAEVIPAKGEMSACQLT